MAQGFHQRLLGAWMRAFAMACAAFVLISCTRQQSSPVTAQMTERLPIIDMHMHARAKIIRAPDGSVVARPCVPQPCTVPPSASTDDAAPLSDTLVAMERHNIVLAHLSDAYSQVDAWQQAAPGRFLASAAVPPHPDDKALPDLVSLRRDFSSGRFKAMGEMGTQYMTIAANDPHAISSLERSRSREASWQSAAVRRDQR
jgi:hypothetical protein